MQLIDLVPIPVAIYGLDTPQGYITYCPELDMGAVAWTKEKSVSLLAERMRLTLLNKRTKYEETMKVVPECPACMKPLEQKGEKEP